MTPARVAVRLKGAAVVFVTDSTGEVRVRWHDRSGWRCDRHGRSRTTTCPHIDAAVHVLTAHLLTRLPMHARRTRKDRAR